MASKAITIAIWLVLPEFLTIIKFAFNCKLSAVLQRPIKQLD